MEEKLKHKIESYQPDKSVTNLVKTTPILLIVGPSGAGKDSLKDKLLATGKYHHIVSHTTRPPRINKGVREKDGLDYHFINTKEAAQMLDDHKFVEAKIFSDNMYGTSTYEILKAKEDKKVAITDMEVQGVREYKKIDKAVMALFLVPPDFTIWQQRLTSRYGDVVDLADHRARLKTALREFHELLSTNYYIAVVNDEINDTFLKVEEIVRVKKYSRDAENRADTIALSLCDDINAYLKDRSD